MTCVFMSRATAICYQRFLRYKSSTDVQPGGFLPAGHSLNMLLCCKKLRFR